MSVEQDEKKEPKNPQNETDYKIASRIWDNFTKWRDNRNLSYSYFRERTCLEYWDDSNQRFNNYRVKPDWKEDYQANISDTTTHSKVMAIVAQSVANRYQPLYKPRFSRDVFSKLKASFLQDLYNYTDTMQRNGELDTLMTVLKAVKEGTVIGFEGYKKTKVFEGIDARIIPLEDFYPSDMGQFRMKDQLKCIWRSVINEDEFRSKFSSWYQADKVESAGKARVEEHSFFSFSDELDDGQVELLRYFDRLNDEFHITANGILITEPGSTLSARRKDGELGFWKTVFEIIDPNFFYGRSLPDLMKDAQDGIDFLFNAMFDKEMLAVMRPLLIGGMNNEIDDYLYPGVMQKVEDVSQVMELKFEGADINSFRVLKELQDRQHFIAVDQVSQGVSIGSKTATEVERSQEAARRIGSLFGIMIKDALTQKARLRAGTIMQYYLNKKKFEPFIQENVSLIDPNKRGELGTRILRIKSPGEISPRNQFGESKQLEIENTMIPDKSEIIEASVKEIKDFEFDIDIKVPSTIEMSPSLRRTFDLQWVQGARGNPQYDQDEVERIHTEAMDKDWEQVKAKRTQQIQPQNQQGSPPSLRSMTPAGI